jgi:EAL domain-containing protein (putative c-di-GMP-specific phosphodiesterase class I)/CheY-like chemotaxis protein
MTKDDDSSDSTLEASRGRVLVVDDNASLLHAFARLLSAEGYSVETALSAAIARVAIDQGPFEVIVTDVMMPEMSGLDFLRVVRQTDLDVPVILVTGAPTLEAATEAVEYGAFRYLRKPITAEVLVDVVGQASRFHRMARLRRRAAEVLDREGHWLGDRAGLEVYFERALEGLWVAYQPIVSLKAKKVFGYEALVRSDEPRLATPDELFDVAERLGRLHELGRAIRRRVAAVAEGAPAGATLFINVHPDDLNDADLWSTTAPLSRIAARVVLELTERSSLDGVKDLDLRLAKLREMGFRIAVDDLGAGYAGLSCFTRLDPEVVKLDMSLVRDLHLSSRKRSVVRSMIRLAQEDLNMLVICEGVETEEERAALERLGADLLQGFFFSRATRGFAPTGG